MRGRGCEVCCWLSSPSGMIASPFLLYSKLYSRYSEGSIWQPQAEDRHERRMDGWGGDDDEPISVHMAFSFLGVPNDDDMAIVVRC